jgi:murein DD-endopeptidase MepM/ murein hydrolase activator NlpD
MDNGTPKSPKGDFASASLAKSQPLKAPFRGLGVNNATPKSPERDFASASLAKSQTLKAPFRGLGVMFVAFFFALSAHAQEIVPPLDIPLFLSGNFGELRSNHFHSGIDFKTQGVTGIPVKAVKAGYISRINVSPYGYGRVVYIDHPDGTTTVYGHLDHFAPKIETAVRDSQYLKESFSVYLNFTPETFPLKQGEMFAYSGNTGSSGGPHLHFEIRTTSSDTPLDAIPAFKNKLKDNRPPEIREIRVFPQAGKGIVNGSAENQSFKIITDKEGKQTLSSPIKAWGDIGLGVKAYDRMDETSNIYGVREIMLKVNGEVIYHSVIDSFSFNDTRYLNSFIDWKEWRASQSFFMKSFIDPGNYFNIYRSPHKGIVHISEEKNYPVEYILKDIYDNTSVLTFNITGQTDSIPQPVNEGLLFVYNRYNEYRGKGIELSVPAKNLYTNVYLKIDTTWNYSPFAPLYSLGERTPLHNSCPLSLKIPNDTYPDKSKYGIVAVYGRGASWLGGEYENGKIATQIRELGAFSVTIDTIPPVITPIQPAKWAANRRIVFKISDNLSGIASYKGILGGQFILFEYDAKTQSLFYRYDDKRMVKNAHSLKLTLVDGVGNETHWERD